MRKVKVLFFAADPHSTAPHGRAPKLGLDEDIRQIRGKVRGAEYRDALDFDFRMAARTDDLIQALNETHPQVVHFSGHGGTDGLVLVSSDGRRPHPVDAEALRRLFRLFRDDIHVAVLNACFSLPQAQAIAAEVGCAIGTRGEISDTAAITFGGSFYRAIAFGKSVKDAYDEAATALALEHVADAECPQLIVHPDVDPAKLFLIPPNGKEPSGRGMKRVVTTIAGLAVAGVAAYSGATLMNRVDPSLPSVRDTVPSDTSSTRTDTTATAPRPAPEPEPDGKRNRVTNAASSETQRSQPPVAPPPAPASEPQVTIPRGSSHPAVVQPLQPTDSFPTLGGDPPDRAVRPLDRP